MPRLTQSDTELETNRNADVWARKVQNTLHSCRTRRTAREKYRPNKTPSENTSNRTHKNVSSKEDLNIEIPSPTEYESSGDGESSCYVGSQHSSIANSCDGDCGSYSEIQINPQKLLGQYQRYNNHHIYSIDELSGESDSNSNRLTTGINESFSFNHSDGLKNVRNIATNQPGFYYLAVKQTVPVSERPFIQFSAMADVSRTSFYANCNGVRLQKSPQLIRFDEPENCQPASGHSKKVFAKTPRPAPRTKFEPNSSERTIRTNQSSRTILIRNNGSEFSADSSGKKSSLEQHLIDNDDPKENQEKSCGCFRWCFGRRRK